MPVDANRDRTAKARKPAKGSGSSGRSESYPVDDLCGRIMRLAMISARREKMTATIADGVAAWGEELWASPHLLRERVEAMRDKLVEGYEAAASAVDDMDQSEKAYVAAAQANLASLGYARDAAMREAARTIEAPARPKPERFLPPPPPLPVAALPARPAADGQQLLLDVA